MKIDVVIGANFGDEGKGLVTDYLATSDKGICARMNGGAQAGHTVVTPDGLRHVFHHFGSASFRGYTTYLGKKFIVNPMIFIKELEELSKIGITPKTIIHPHAIITTPFDMIINQVREESLRNGSCGVGIFETIKRNGNKNFQMNMHDLIRLVKEKKLAEYIKSIRDVYALNRLDKIGVESIPLKHIAVMFNDAIIENYVKDAERFLANITTSTTFGTLKMYDHIIFEGAQGLLLDKDNTSYYPNLTPSNTGMTNISGYIETLVKYFNAEVNVNYVTRAYMTRHGNGRFDTELKEKPYKGIVDLTNVSNPYQGSIRYGDLDVTLLSETIMKDLDLLFIGEFKVNLFVTCLDQIGADSIMFVRNGAKVKTSIDRFLSWGLSSEIIYDNIYTSWGMTRDTVLKATIKK